MCVSLTPSVGRVFLHFIKKRTTKSKKKDNMSTPYYDTTFLKHCLQCTYPELTHEQAWELARDMVVPPSVATDETLIVDDEFFVGGGKVWMSQF